MTTYVGQYAEEADTDVVYVVATQPPGQAVRIALFAALIAAVDLAGWLGFRA